MLACLRDPALLKYKRQLPPAFHATIFATAAAAV